MNAGQSRSSPKPGIRMLDIPGDNRAAWAPAKAMTVFGGF
jgi:hypothetical protein